MAAMSFPQYPTGLTADAARLGYAGKAGIRAADAANPAKAALCHVSPRARAGPGTTTPLRIPPASAAGRAVHTPERAPAAAPVRHALSPISAAGATAQPAKHAFGGSLLAYGGPTSASSASSAATSGALEDAPHGTLQHTLRPNETLASLAITYAVPIAVLRRYNALWTEDALFLRRHITVPVNPDAPAFAEQRREAIRRHCVAHHHHGHGRKCGYDHIEDDVHGTALGAAAAAAAVGRYPEALMGTLGLTGCEATRDRDHHRGAANAPWVSGWVAEVSEATAALDHPLNPEDEDDDAPARGAETDAEPDAAESLLTGMAAALSLEAASARSPSPGASPAPCGEVASGPQGLEAMLRRVDTEIATAMAATAHYARRHLSPPAGAAASAALTAAPVIPSAEPDAHHHAGSAAFWQTPYLPRTSLDSSDGSNITGASGTTAGSSLPDSGATPTLESSLSWALDTTDTGIDRFDDRGDPDVLGADGAVAGASSTHHAWLNTPSLGFLGSVIHPAEQSIIDNTVAWAEDAPTATLAEPAAAQAAAMARDASPSAKILSPLPRTHCPSPLVLGAPSPLLSLSPSPSRPSTVQRRVRVVNHAAAHAASLASLAPAHVVFAMGPALASPGATATPSPPPPPAATPARPSSARSWDGLMRRASRLTRSAVASVAGSAPASTASSARDIRGASAASLVESSPSAAAASPATSTTTTTTAASDRAHGSPIPRVSIQTASFFITADTAVPTAAPPTLAPPTTLGAAAGVLRAPPTAVTRHTVVNLMASVGKTGPATRSSGTTSPRADWVPLQKM